MANVKVAMSKKGMLIALVIGVLLLGGGGGYLLWRVNQEDTVAPTDSDASEMRCSRKCKPGKCSEYGGVNGNCTQPGNSEELVGCTTTSGKSGCCLFSESEEDPNNCRVVTYDIIFKAGSNGSVSPTKATPKPGGEATSTATPSTGYIFVDWKDSAGKVITASKTLKVENVQADATYTATFTQDTPICAQVVTSLKYSADSNGTIQGNANQTYNDSCGESTAVTAVAKDSTKWKFSHWVIASTGAKDTSSLASANPRKDPVGGGTIDVKAIFVSTTPDKPEEYTLKARVNPPDSGGSVVIIGGEYTKGETIPTLGLSVTKGTSYTITAKVPTGYKFVKWTKQYDGQGEVDFEIRPNENPATGREFNENVIFIANISPSSSNICGDGICSAGESPATCPADCSGGGSGTVPDTAIFEDTKDTIIFGIVILMIGVAWTWIVTLPKKAYNSISKASREYVTAVKQSEERNKRESRRNKLERKLK